MTLDATGIYKNDDNEEVLNLLSELITLFIYIVVHNAHTISSHFIVISIVMLDLSICEHGLFLL